MAVSLNCGSEPASRCQKEPSFFFQPGLDVDGVVLEAATRVSLDEFCDGAPGLCPATLEAALAARFGSPVVVRGCGVESVRGTIGGLAGRLWNYDSATSALIGAARFDDVVGRVGGCEDSAFQAGEGPPLEVSPDGGAVSGHRRTCASVVVDSALP